MKTKFIVLIVLSLLIPISGCWSSHQLNTLSIVQGIGIDLTDDNRIELSLQILIPQQVKPSGASGGEGGKAVWILTSEGETVFEAIRNATLKSDRRLYLSHNRIIVLSENVARTGIAPFLDFLHRNRELRDIAHLFVARGKAQDIIEAEHEQENIPALGIESLAEMGMTTSKIPRKTRLYDVLKTLDTSTSDPVIAGINTAKSMDKEKNKELVKLDDTAIFKKDKLVGWFDGNETRGVLWLLGEVESGIIVLKSPSDEAAKLSIEIIRASSKVIPEIIDENLALTINIKVECLVGEQMNGIDLSEPDSIRELNKGIEDAVKKEINSALEKAQKWGVDIFRVGEETHKRLPKEWPALKNNWEEEFQNLEVVVNVEAEIQGTGIITNPTNTVE